MSSDEAGKDKLMHKKYCKWIGSMTACLGLAVALCGCGETEQAAVVTPLPTPEPVVYTTQEVTQQDIRLNTTLNAWLESLEVSYIEESAASVYAPDAETVGAEIVSGDNLLYKASRIDNGTFVKEGDVICSIQNRVLEAAYSNAQASLTYAQQQSAAAPEDTALQAEVQQLETLVAQYEEEMSKLDVVAPKSGCVEFTFRDGQTAMFGEQVATIYECKLTYNGPQYKDLYVGDVGTIEFWQNETQYQSNVIVTYNAGAGRRNPVLNEDASYVVEFTLEDKDTPVTLQTMATITFYDVCVRENALCIPAAAVKQDDEGYSYVDCLMENNRTKRCYVVTGITSEDGSLLELVESQFTLQAGDELVIG